MIYTRCLYPYLYPHQYLSLYQTWIHIIFFSLFIVKHWCARLGGSPSAGWRISWLQGTCTSGKSNTAPRGVAHGPIRVWVGSEAQKWWKEMVFQGLSSEWKHFWNYIYFPKISKLVKSTKSDPSALSHSCCGLFQFEQKKKKKILPLVMPGCSELTSVMGMCNFGGIPYGMSHHTANFLCFLNNFVYLFIFDCAGSSLLWGCFP